MRKVLYLFLLSLILPLSAESQQVASGVVLYHDQADPEVHPPKLLPPIWSQENGSDMSFNWEPVAVSAESEVIYELVLTTNNEMVYTVKTRENVFLYTSGLPQLKKGNTYTLTLNTYISDLDKSYILSGKENALSFLYVPICTPPVNPYVSEQGADYFTVSWGGPSAVPKDFEYVVRFRTNGEKWNELTVENGTSVRVENVRPRVKTYEIEVAKQCYWSDGSKVISEWNHISYGQRTSSGCDTTSYSYPTVPCTPGLAANANPGRLSIGGYAILVSDVSSSVDQNGKLKWEGNGVIDLPFSSGSSVQVEWENAVINSSYEICQGVVTGISDEPKNLPDYTPGPIAFGGEICIPPPSSPGFDTNGIHNVTGLPWDPNGFGPDSLYAKQPPYPGYQPGFPYDTTGRFDPNGFDVNGIHALTGTPFNPLGCSAEGVDSLGQPCNPNVAPYSWMDPTNDSPATQAGLGFVATLGDSLNIFIQQRLILLNNQTQDSIDHQEYICNGLRSQMTTLVSTINQQVTPDIDPAFLFGDNNEYFNAGMHQNFTKRPEPLAQHYSPSQRVPEMTALENKHIDLYDCDKKQYVFVHIQEIINAFLGSDFNDLREVILNRITQQPPTQIKQFISDHTYFLTWLTDQVKIAVQSKYLQQYSAGIGAVDGTDSYFNVAERKPIYPEVETADFVRAGSMLAAGSFPDEVSDLLLQQSADVRPEDIAFDYLQGFKMVNGVHRAYYMEAICAERGRSPLTEANADLMPIVVQNIGSDGRTNRVYLDNIRFRVDQPALMDVYVVLDLPGSSGQRIVFESIDAEFTPNGLVLNPLELQLANDIYFRLNNVARLKLLAGDSTFVAVDCNGFAGLGIAADVELCRSIVKPYNPVTGEILPEPARVSGHFSTYAPNFTEIMVSFSMDPFVITGVEDVKWLIDGVTLDMSETVSPIGAPPQGYNTPFANGSGFKPLWKGFYIKDIQVSLPNKFTSNNTPVTVGVHDLVIDDRGVSCSVSAENILDLGKGNAGGWAFNIESFELTVIMNNLSKAAFSGVIHVPIFRNATNTSGSLTAGDCFNYEATIQPGNIYRFSISQPEETSYSVDMWKAGTVSVISSSIELRYDTSFHAVATLNGIAEIADDLSPNIAVDIPPITFQNVQVSNEAPYFSPGQWGFPNSVGAKLAGFELSFYHIGMYQTEDGDPALTFQAHIGITDDTTKISATGGFRVTGQLLNDNGRQRWQYKSFKVTDVDIHGSFPGVEYVHGVAVFYEGDAVYGTGFRGGLSAKFELVEASVQVVGQFGRVSGFKYFFLDALLCLGPGAAPIGAIDIRGLGGGVYYHMNRPDDAPALPACSGPPVIPSQNGASLSGIVYTPDSTVSIGIKLTVAVALATQERAFNANATFEMLFYEGGGVDRIWIYGNAKFMDDLNLSGLPTYVESGLPNNTAAISANLDIRVNFHTKVMDGELDVYANVAGVLTGVGQNGRVCQALVHFGPNNDWYIKIGAPDSSSRAGMIFSIPGFGEIARSQTYLQIGTNIDPIPPLPSDIASLTGLHPTQRSFIENGNGFCFGVDVRLGNKDFNFLMFYAGLAIHLGFDISILNYGPDAVCEGNTSPIGINGWYAEGQIYAGIQASMGIRVKVFGKRKEFNLLSLQVAAALEAKLPNPFWARGAVGFDYNILNGLVKGHGNFEFEIGQQCVIVGQDNPLLNVPIISNTIPANNSKSLPVNIEPVIRFNFPVGESFEFNALDDSHISYLVVLDSAKLLWRNQHEMSTQKEWSLDKKSLKLKLDYFLPAKDTFILIVKAHVDSSGITISSEERIVTFITGPGLTYIPADNVAGSYPLDGQFNFYKNEITNGKGYIQLKRGQPDLFFEKTGYQKYVRFRGSGSCVAIPLQIESENFWEKKIEFDLPTNFVNQQLYEMQVIEFPSAGISSTGNTPCECSGCTLPVPSPTNTGAGSLLAVSLSNDDGHGEAPPPSGPPSAQTPTEKVLYAAYFRVSQYNTFLEKVTAFQNTMLNSRPSSGDTPEEAPSTYVNEDFSRSLNIEPFDGYEINGGDFGGPLVQVRSEYGTAAVSDPDSWIGGMKKRYFYPYQGLVNVIPSSPFGYSNYYPTNTVLLTPYPPSGLIITKSHFTNGLPANYNNVLQTIRHYTPYEILRNYQVASNLLNDYVTTHHDAIHSTLENIDCGCEPGMSLDECFLYAYLGPCEPYPYNIRFYDMYTHIDNDGISPAPYTYPVKVSYHLPGTNQQTYSGIIILKP